MIVNKVEFRAIEEYDLELLMNYRNKLKSVFRQYKTLNKKNQEQWFKFINESDSVEMFGIMINGNEHLSGVCGLCYISWVNRTAEVSFFIGDAFYKGGEAEEIAVKMLIDKAFNEFNLNRLWIETYAHNTTNQVLFKKCGFVQEGILRDHVYKDGKYRDSYISGLLKKEWKIND